MLGAACNPPMHLAMRQLVSVLLGLGCIPPMHLLMPCGSREAEGALRVQRGRGMVPGWRALRGHRMLTLLFPVMGS